MLSIKHEKKEAMILAAGRGTRMRYKTKYIAKPLIKINSKSLLEINLTKLVKAKVKSCTLNVSYMKNTIKSFIKKFEYRNKYPKITIVCEKDRLETGGGVKNAAKYF